MPVHPGIRFRVVSESLHVELEILVWFRRLIGETEYSSAGKAHFGARADGVCSMVLREERQPRKSYLAKLAAVQYFHRVNVQTELPTTTSQLVNREL